MRIQIIDILDFRTDEQISRNNCIFTQKSLG